MPISHIKSNVIGDFTGTVTVYNSQGSTATAAATDLVRPSDWNSAHNVTMGLYGNTLGNSTAGGSDLAMSVTGGGTLSGNGSSVVLSLPGQPIVSDAYFPMFGVGAAGSAPVNGNFSMYPITVHEQINVSRLELFASLSVASALNASSAYFDYSIAAGVYTMSAATKLNLYGSTTQNTWTSWSSNTTSNVAGPRALSIPWATTLTPGTYVLGFALSTTSTATGGANSTALGNTLTMMNVFSHSSMLNSNYAAAAPLGAATAGSDQYARFCGVYTAATASAPSTVGSNDINDAGTAVLRAMNVVRLRNI